MNFPLFLLHGVGNPKGKGQYYFHTTHKKENDNRTEFNQSRSSIGIDKWKDGFQTFPVVRNPGEWLLGFHRFTCWIFDISTPFLTSFQLAA